MWFKIFVYILLRGENSPGAWKRLYPKSLFWKEEKYQIEWKKQKWTRAMRMGETETIVNNDLEDYDVYTFL